MTLKIGSKITKDTIPFSGTIIDGVDRNFLLKLQLLLEIAGKNIKNLLFKKKLK